MHNKPLSQWTNEELWRIFPIVLAEHDPHWGAQYAAESDAIIRAVGDPLVLRIRHIGSTAVAGLVSKPTIDILLEIADDADMRLLNAAMQKLGYLYSPQPHNPAPHAMYLKGYTPQGFAGQSFHVHVRYMGDYDEPYFCEYLNTHPKIAAEYGELKIGLLRRYQHDRDAYTQAKTQFIREVTALAREHARAFGEDTL